MKNNDNIKGEPPLVKGARILVETIFKCLKEFIWKPLLDILGRIIKWIGEKVKEAVSLILAIPVGVIEGIVLFCVWDIIGAIRSRREEVLKSPIMDDYYKYDKYKYDCEKKSEAGNLAYYAPLSLFDEELKMYVYSATFLSELPFSKKEEQSNSAKIRSSTSSDERKTVDANAGANKKNWAAWVSDKCRAGLQKLVLKVIFYFRYDENGWRFCWNKPKSNDKPNAIYVKVTLPTIFVWFFACLVSIIYTLFALIIVFPFSFFKGGEERCKKCGRTHSTLPSAKFGIFSRKCVCGEKIEHPIFVWRK